MALKGIKERDMSFDLILPFQSKVWPTKFSGGINKSLKFALQKIGAFSCMDTYFLHMPSESWSTNLTAYKQLIECMNRGQTSKIGLGHFQVDLLEKLFRFTGTHPHVLQENLSVNKLDLELLEYCKTHKIELQAYEPFGEFRSNQKNPVLLEIADKYSSSVKNILISYLLELGVVPVVPASTPEEIHDLVRSKELKLSVEDMDVLKRLNKYKPKRRKSL